MSITKDFEEYLSTIKMKDYSGTGWIEKLKNKVLKPNVKDNEWFIKLYELQHKHGFDSDLFGTYMEESGLTNSNLGQFYTPMHVAKIMSLISTPVDFQEYLDSKYVGVNDPCSGTGRFMIAHSSTAKDKMNEFWTPTSFKYINTDLDCNNYVFSSLNAIMRNLFSVNIWGNSITNEVYGAIMTFPNTSGIASFESNLNLEEIKKLFLGNFKKDKKIEKENINLKLF